ncbi:Zinc finger, C2H2 type [Popillia japonica]|uniref:Zinc finger, C2H2 type n=1 Tax=Popillia japonica TaxID=7064 RepID=A0AAW1JYT6_POPJA
MACEALAADSFHSNDYLCTLYRVRNRIGMESFEPLCIQGHILKKKKFECKVCGSKTNRLSDLKAHIRIHTGERPFSCEICSKSYRIIISEHHLTSHIRSHTGERNHKCTICNKAFPEKKTLKVHLESHNAKENYKCEQCETLYV